MQVEINKEFITNLEQLIAAGNNRELSALFEEMHPADIAEILEELNFDNALFIIKLLNAEKTSEILTELDDDTREKVLKELSSEETAKEIDELNSDDAADIIGELSEKQKEEVISQIEDVEHAKDIVDLLRYDEDTAGGLMGKELIKVNENWFLVDLPGYGYARVSKKQRRGFQKFIKDYFLKREQLICTFVLIDSRHNPQKIDLDFMGFLGENQIPFCIVFTKADKLTPTVLKRNLAVYKEKLLEDSWELIQFWRKRVLLRPSLCS